MVGLPYVWDFSLYPGFLSVYLMSTFMIKLGDKVFLSKILSSEKYNVCPGEDQESYEKRGVRVGSSK